MGACCGGRSTDEHSPCYVIRRPAAPRRFASVLGLALVGCHGGSGGVSFQGRSRAPIVVPEQVLETHALPRGVTRLGSLTLAVEHPALASIS